MKKRTTIRIVAALLLGAVSMTAFAVQRTFVASYGLDSNPCSLTSPCRSFATALAVTETRGEVVVLDSAGYGPVTITAPVSIVAPEGVYGGISVFAGQDGITVNGAFTTDRVVLRGLTINGQGGNRGIVVQQGTVHIERCVVSNMNQEGIRVEGGANSAVHVSHSVVRGNQRGIVLASGNSARVYVDDTQVAQNSSTGIYVQSGILALNRVQIEGNPGNGLRLEPAASVTVDAVMRDSVVTGGGSRGVLLVPQAATSVARLVVERSTATRNGESGFGAISNSGGEALIFITSSVASGNLLDGVVASGTGAKVYVRDSTIVRHTGRGIRAELGGVAMSCQNNMVVENATANLEGVTNMDCTQ